MLNLDEMKKKKDGIMTRLSAAIATGKTDEIAPVMREWCDYVEESVTAEPVSYTHLTLPTIA